MKQQAKNDADALAQLFHLAEKGNVLSATAYVVIGKESSMKNSQICFKWQ